MKSKPLNCKELTDIACDVNTLFNDKEVNLLDRLDVLDGVRHVTIKIIKEKIDDVDPKTHAVRISGTVGKKKKEVNCDEKGD